MFGLFCGVVWRVLEVAGWLPYCAWRMLASEGPHRYREAFGWMFANEGLLAGEHGLLVAGRWQVGVCESRFRSSFVFRKPANSLVKTQLNRT